MRSLIVVALALTAVGAASCSSGDDADPATTIAASAPTTSTIPDPTTTNPPATTSTTSTTDAPTTTIDPTDALIADIEADLNAGEAALLAAGADPSNAALRDDLSIYFSGEALDRTQALVDGWARDGLLVRENPQLASSIIVYSISERDESDPPAWATIEACRLDAAVVYEPLPDGREAIVDDVTYRSVFTTRVDLVDGTWRAEGGPTLSQSTASTTCDE